ncbi:MAG TPA: hypothetical protein VI968_01045 [archaeon]|nr:hypothetical protein [archaeon]
MSEQTDAYNASDFNKTRKILKELSLQLNVPANDIPKTLRRFKKEIEES